MIILIKIIPIGRILIAIGLNTINTIFDGGGVILSFLECCQECIKNNELIDQYCRLKGVKRPDRLSPVEIIVDRACGYNAKDKFIRGFTDFVFLYVWVPMVNREWEEIDQ